jgi:hypothetical protein
MKNMISLIFLALFPALLGQNQELKIDFGSNVSSSMSIKVEPKETKSGLLVLGSTESARIFELNGIPTIQFSYPGGGYNFAQNPQYKRPEKPEQVKAELWTADGKKWVAKWEEVKP